MKKLQFLLVIGLLSLLLQAAPAVTAQSPQPEPRKEYYQGLALCLPNAYPQEPDGCLALGPSESLSNYAKVGISIPQTPIPAKPISSSLGVVPFQYLLMNEQSVPVFNSQEDAAAKNTQRTIAPGKKYLAYRKRVESDGQVFYQFQTGEWVRGESVASRVGYSSESRGVLLSGVPRTTFGWTIDLAEPLDQPGWKAGRPTGRKISIYSLLYIYDTQTVDGAKWVMTGPNEWLEDRIVAKVFYNPVPPEGVTNGRWVEISLSEQTVSVYDNNRLVFAALAATGIKNMATRPGLFHVTKKVAAEHMTGAFTADRSDFYYLESVPWTVYFDEARAIHGVYWRTSYGRPASHGCVNLTIADSRWLYDWIKEGDAVYAWSE